ncbi:STAS domain-containing protein [Dactylosporangium sp. NPDC005572]|uniref:STAS domain-containing protein n=1 Tax=Dactylosporangium sp. NPDC005572 TaxID=3156889 RepID=UPI0033ACC6DA
MNALLAGVDFGVTITQRGGTLRVTVAGDVDAATAPRLAAFLRTDRVVRRVELDLSGVTYFSSAGMEVVHGARRAGVDVVLVAVAPPVERLLALLPPV